MTRGAAFKEAVRAAYVKAHPDERFTDTALAKRSGVSDFTLRRLWAGDVPSLSTLLSIANAADISIIDALMALQGQMPPVVAGDPVARIADAMEGIRSEIRTLQPPPPTQAQLDPEDRAWIAERVAETLAQEPAPHPTSPRRRTQG